ncbi:hypothetical protein [Psychrobacter sp. JCM 18900]|uniref:hypothetical protein n=1 Tax=Psychrobacter sp. JCM 18900 TaxID=1298608 RepID=UPI0004348215|nr:hypothetical protein [Psychrobacter sp. JCM 18900]GAF53040.1 hypothetical protein JCM18900_11593 [Psychrobacter sp. JCM 18900]
MQDGMPYAVTQVTTVPRYVVRQSPVVQGTTTVTSVPVTNSITNKVTKVDVITTPASSVTQVLPVATNVTPPVIMQQPVTNQVTTTTTTLDTLQLTPTFSTPGVVNANTKVMKILKKC